MMRQSIALALMLLAGAISTACATAPVGKVPQGAQQLTAPEIQAVLAAAARDRAVFDDGFDGGVTYALQPGGAMQVSSRSYKDKTFAGTWRVDANGNMLCTRVEKDPESCAALYKISADTFYLAVPGLSQQANTFKQRRR
ncbi:MAG: hypothetical protein ACRCV9_14385 [Burkholderiaceae bacterium]